MYRSNTDRDVLRDKDNGCEVLSNAASFYTGPGNEIWPVTMSRDSPRPALPYLLLHQQTYLSPATPLQMSVHVNFMILKGSSAVYTV
jgi:hypothetical protein